jgi:hypothetical protein
MLSDWADGTPFTRIMHNTIHQLGAASPAKSKPAAAGATAEAYPAW